MLSFLSKITIVRALIFLASGWFVFVCLAHLLSFRPLWLDENSILHNLKDLTGMMIFGPLLESQVFPRLYLFLIQRLAIIFDYHLLSLRILPFVFMVGAFFVWLKIYGKEKLTELQHLLLVFSWSASYYLIYYAAELKQYSCDVFVAAIFVIFLYKQKEIINDKKMSALAKISLFLPILLLFSYVSFLFVWVPLYNFVLMIKDNKKNLYFGIYYLLSLIFFVCLAYYFDIRFYKGGVHGYWQDYFISLGSFREFFKNIGEGINRLMSCWFQQAKIVKRIARFFAIFGFYSIFHFFIVSFKKERFRIESVNTLTFVLFAELILLGILKIYPFTGGRVTLFFAPFVLFAIIKGIYLLRKIHPVLFILVVCAYGIFLSSNAVHLLIKFLSL